jgi:DNA-binding Xre family transcriptional regulator
VWKASDLRRALAEAGLVLSAGKMSHLWSGRPISVRLDDLDVICAVLECSPSELLLPDPPAQQAPTRLAERPSPAASIRPSRTGRRRSAPPV